MVLERVKTMEKTNEMQSLDGLEAEGTDTSNLT